MDRLEILRKEIDDYRKELYTDNLSMSISELASLYSDGELNINPNFQRFYRWTIEQKCKLIESVMLNIPIPSIFVQENEGAWDVIDGLQRLSTFFEFMGILKNEKGVAEPLVLNKAKYLKHFENAIYENKGQARHADKGYFEFDKILRFDFKSYRIDVKIIKRNSDSSKRYEMFQRLNTGGTSLQPQEVRNCIMIMENENVYNFIEKLSQDTNLKSILPLSSKQLEERYDMEMVSRYIVAKYCDLNESDEEDLPFFLNEFIVKICNDKNLIDFESENSIFERTCTLLNEKMQDSAFKKFNTDKKKFLGAFLTGNFVAIMLGVSNNIEFWEQNKDTLESKIIEFQKTEHFNKMNKQGTRVTGRLKLAKEASIFFSEVNDG